MISDLTVGLARTIDEDRSPLVTPADIQRARERVLDAMLRWWEKAPLATEGDEVNSTREGVARMMRWLLLDAEKASRRSSAKKRRNP